MNNQEVGYVFAEKFNNEDVSYGDGYNVLRGKGYSASFNELLFTQQFYGDPEYGVAKYDNNSDGYKIQWVFTSSLTQSFYNANPGIDPTETLLTLYQNYIPTSSISSILYGDAGSGDQIEYTLTMPTRPNTALYNIDSGSIGTLKGEYYYLGGNTVLNAFSIATSSLALLTNTLQTFGINYTGITYTPGTQHSASFSINIPSAATELYLKLWFRSLTTGSILVLRNLSLSYPVDISNFEPFAQTQDLHLQTSTGMTNARYNGCKMTSPDFNIDSPDTVDGGPVVTITPVNPKSPTIGSSVPKNRVPKAEIQTPGFVSGKGNFKIK